MLDRRLTRGLGLYPDAECYDPSKSFLWPNIIDTPTELECMLAKSTGQYPGVDYKTEYPVPPSPVAPGVPPSGNVAPEDVPQIIDKLITDADMAEKLRIQKFYQDLGKKLDDCSWYQTKGADGACHLGSTTLWIVAAAGVAAAVYLKR